MSDTPARPDGAPATAPPRRPRAPVDPTVAAAFNLVGVRMLPEKYAEEAAVLDAYRRELEASLEHQPPRPDELALVDSARRARSMILLLTRKVYRRGLVSRKGFIRAEVGELRAWLRLEADILNRLTFKDGMKTTGLKLIEAKAFSSGVVLLRYQPVRGEE